MIPKIDAHVLRSSQPEAHAANAFTARTSYAMTTTTYDLTVHSLCLDIALNLGLHSIAVRKQLGLLIKQLLVRLCRILVVGAFDDGIDGTSFLARAAEDALCHVDVVARCAARAVGAGFGLDGDCLRGTDCLAEFAGDAALLTGRVAAEGVLAAEAGREGPFFHRVVERHFRLEEILHRQRQAAEELGQVQGLARLGDDCGWRGAR